MKLGERCEGRNLIEIGGKNEEELDQIEILSCVKGNMIALSISLTHLAKDVGFWVEVLTIRP